MRSLRALFLLGFFFAAPSYASDLTDALANADLKAGERLFKRCATCHTLEEGGAMKVGPNLYGIINKAVASFEDYKYSKGMRAYGGKWTLERLNAYLTQPRAEVRGTKMAFAGLRKASDRAHLIAYMNSFSVEPLAFGKGGDSVHQEPTEGETEVQDFGVLKRAKGVEVTFYACTPCHSERIVAQQGLTREDWAKLFVWMVEEQGMDKIEEPELGEILDYLAAHYNTDRPNFPGK